MRHGARALPEEGLEPATNGGGADKVMTAVVSGKADMGWRPEAAIYVYEPGQGRTIRGSWPS